MAKRFGIRWFPLMVLGVLAVSLAACTDDGGGNGGTSTDEPVDSGTATPFTGTILTPEDILEKDGSATNEDEVVWGTMFELSGGILQGFGEPTSDGVKLAVQEINDEGGFQVGDTVYMIRLIEKDTRSDVATTLAVTQELVRDDGVNVIFGPATLGEPQATQITQPQKVIHICPCQERETTALETKELAQGDSHWAFQTLLPFSILIGNGAKLDLQNNPDTETLALLCQNTETGKDICSRTREAYEAIGVEVLAEEYFPADTTDYSPFLTRIKNAGNPDYLFNFDDPLKQASIVRQALELDVGGRHIASLPANLIRDLVGRDITKPVAAGAAPRQHVQPTSEKARLYFERYKAYKGGGDLPLAAFTSLLMYDYVYMLAAAMQQAGTVEDTTAIADAMETLHYNGVAEDDMFFNSRHLGVVGTDPCTVTQEPGQDVQISCEHNAPPPEAAN